MSSTPLYPAQPQLGWAMTFEEWVAMDEDAPGELVDGRLEEEEVPDCSTSSSSPGWSVSSETGSAGADLCSARRASTPCDRIVAASRTSRSTSILKRAARLRAASCAYRRIWVAEVVSPSPRNERRDRIEKMDEYASFGVSWYWIVDPSLQSLEIFELTAGRYARAARATEGRMESVPGCSGLQLDLDEILSEIARLEGPQQR
jgi:hypothetical protein